MVLSGYTADVDHHTNQFYFTTVGTTRTSGVSAPSSHKTAKTVVQSGVPWQQHCWSSGGRCTANSRVITVPGIDRQREMKDSRCFIFVFIFGICKRLVEGMGGWPSAGINLLLIFTANTFASVYPTLGLQMFKLSVRGNRWSVKAMYRYLFSSVPAQVMVNRSCMVVKERSPPKSRTLT